MDSSRRVFLFTALSVVIFIVASIAAYVFNFNKSPFQKVNLLSDIIIARGDSVKSDSGNNSTAIVIEKQASKNFELYNRQRFITEFNSDTNSYSLGRFMEKLYRLDQTKKGKIRIAYFGDSMIEGDLLTQTVRKLLQNRFGGAGVGYVPVTSPVSGFRQTVYSSYSDNWEDANFKETKNKPLYISGHSFFTEKGTMQMRDQTIVDSLQLPIEKSILFGKTATPITIVSGSSTISINGEHLFNRQNLASSVSKVVGLSITNSSLPVYGISFESSNGIFVDNFSFRGITGVELGKIDSALLKDVNEFNKYDLIVFQYGVNLMYKPEDNNFNWYSRAMKPVIRKYKNCFDNANLLIVSTADRAFRYDGEYKSATGIETLVKLQASLAYETGTAFYNQFQTMGGTNSIVTWANSSPSMAGKDYVHPNSRGAELLGTYFFESLMKDYDKYVRSVNKK